MNTRCKRFKDTQYSMLHISFDGMVTVPSSSPLVEKSLNALNIVLDKDDPQETLKALQDPDANFPFVYRDKEAIKYHEALIEEKKQGLPQCLLVMVITIASKLLA